MSISWSRNLLPDCLKMDVLKPDVYWIGDRCYRINPCPTSQIRSVSYNAVEDESFKNTGNVDREASVEASKPYVEVDEFEDAPAPPDEDINLELSTDNRVQVMKEDNCFKIVCNIPSSLFSHIIGTKGSVKKRVEAETRTRILVPRQNEKGDIVVRGQTERDVRRAHKRIQQIAQNGRFKREVTHFACFPMNNAAVVQKAYEFQKNVLKDCGRSSYGLDSSVFQEPEKLHLTICVLVLLDERERREAAELLSSIQNEIKERMQGNNKLRIRLKGLEIMNDDPSQAHVLYAKCEPVADTDHSIIQNIADIICRKFAEIGLGKESHGENVKLHCTIINTRYRSDEAKDKLVPEHRKQDDQFKRRNNGGSSRESFDARPVLKNYGEFEFGEVEICEVKIATRHTTANDGFYKCYAGISL